MKKTQPKKLAVGRETIRALDLDKLVAVAGGAPHTSPWSVCPECGSSLLAGC